MANGEFVHNGALAVDSSSIRLGSRVLIKGRPYTATDTGGDIRGARVDIWTADCGDAIRNGRCKIQITIFRSR